MSYRRHPLEIGPLVFGLVYLGIVAAWGLFELGVVGSADAAWIVPVVLVGAGGLGVVLAATGPRRAATAPATPAASMSATTTPAGLGDRAHTGTPYDTDETPSKEHRDE